MKEIKESINVVCCKHVASMVGYPTLRGICQWDRSHGAKTFKRTNLTMLKSIQTTLKVPSNCKHALI